MVLTEIRLAMIITSIELEQCLDWNRERFGKPKSERNRRLVPSLLDRHDRLPRHSNAICQLLLSDVLKQAVAAYGVSNVILSGHNPKVQYALHKVKHTVLVLIDFCSTGWCTNRVNGTRGVVAE
jgi:hypothetical protein